MAKKLPVALQLYTVRDHTAKDMAGTLRKVAQMGYEGVELAGYGDSTREGVKAITDELGLKIVASHSNWDNLNNNLDDVIAEAKYLGLQHVVLPSLGQPYREGDAAKWKDAAQILDGIGSKLRQSDLQLCYHNHAFEFDVKSGDDYGLDILLSADNLQSELDVYWVKKGGESPVEYIQKYANQVPLLHIKDIAPDGDFAEIGNGTFDWQTIFDAAEQNGVQYYIVEQDRCPGDSLESAQLSADNLKKMGKL